MNMGLESTGNGKEYRQSYAGAMLLCDAFAYCIRVLLISVFDGIEVLLYLFRCMYYRIPNLSR